MQARKSSPLGILVSSPYENRYGENFQITQLPYDRSQLLKALEDVVESGAVFVPTVMPNNVPFSSPRRLQVRSSVSSNDSHRRVSKCGSVSHTR